MPNQYQAKKTPWDSQKIQALRRHLGLTQRELADRLGTRQQTISEWETGMYQPRGASATLLAIIAEQAKFKYEAAPPQKPPKKS
ncbi:MAG: helix-turn-helix domain-containing protein [Dehalococcoidales bacterium]